MKLLRFGEVGFEKPGIEDEGGIRYDVSGFGEDYDENFFESEGVNRLKSWFAIHKNSCPRVMSSLRLGPPLKRPSKIICVGLNYREHAIESGMKIPKEPILFYKATSAICGPNDPLELPKASVKTDWEVELAVVIAKKTKYATPLNAMQNVAGYLLHNDYSERAFQLEHGGQWLKGKSSDSFAPSGPFLVTKDEITDPHNLKMWLDVNGKRMQESSTSDLIFNIPYLIAYISKYMSLLPGDIISTGTPAGVGMGLKPPRYLKSGDVVELGINGLGSSKQKVIAYSD
ncbi:fumarylacetoacetate hydrolase family protein [Portibacter marinus]|uniref:fumarylacetoacetate hydrolase family protein n=1 Tax=Portibacter marinus TaxID=2898660 RepID=UPI001F1EB924|nr:fumarylacetoacetate hydrolase family protein [Portibacter marinus]